MECEQLRGAETDYNLERADGLPFFSLLDTVLMPPSMEASCRREVMLSSRTWARRTLFVLLFARILKSITSFDFQIQDIPHAALGLDCQVPPGVAAHLEFNHLCLSFGEVEA